MCFTDLKARLLSVPLLSFLWCRNLTSWDLWHMHFFLQEKNNELPSQWISCQAVKMTNIHITATSAIVVLSN